MHVMEVSSWILLCCLENPVYLENYDPTIQWMITNIPASGDVSQGDELVEYLGATPLKNEFPNRMVFLLFRQRFGRIEPALRIKADQLYERGMYFFVWGIRFFLAW